MSYTKKDQLRSWIYLLFIVLTSIPISGVFYSFGLIIDVFLEEYGGTNSKAGWIGAVLLSSAGISSLVGVYLFRYFGLRRVALASGVLTVFAFVSTPHIPNLGYIFLTYSIPFGIATGFHECITVVSLREYFSKQLGLATGVRYAATGIGTVLVSYLIPIILDVAGWHAMITSFASLGLMYAVLAISYKPLPIVEENDASGAMLHTKEDELQYGCLQATKSLLKDKRMLLFLTGNALFSVVQYIPNIFMIQYARSLGYPISKSKWMLVSFSSFSIVSRCVSGCVSDYVMKFNKLRVLHSAVMIFFGLFSAVCSFTHSLPLMTVYMGAIGVLDGMYWVMISLVAMEINHQYSDITFTLLLCATAFGYLVGPPAIGWLYDATGNFSHVLYVVGAGAVTAGFFLFAGTLWKEKPELYKNMVKTVIETSELKKCSLVVFERETVI